MKNRFWIIGALFLAAVILTGVLVALTIYPSAHAEMDRETCYDSIEIEAHDTLWSIAEEYAADYGCSTREYTRILKDLNHLSGDTIVSGNHLLVVYYGE